MDFAPPAPSRWPESRPCMVCEWQFPPPFEPRGRRPVALTYEYHGLLESPMRKHAFAPRVGPSLSTRTAGAVAEELGAMRGGQLLSPPFYQPGAGVSLRCTAYGL